MSDFQLSYYLSKWAITTSKFIYAPEIKPTIIFLPDTIFSGDIIIDIASEELGNIVLKYPYRVGYEVDNYKTGVRSKRIDISSYSHFTLHLPKNINIRSNIFHLKLDRIAVEVKLKKYLTDHGWPFLSIPGDLITSVIDFILKTNDGLIETTVPLKHEIDENNISKISYSTDMETKIFTAKNIHRLKILVEAKVKDKPIENVSNTETNTPTDKKD